MSEQICSPVIEQNKRLKSFNTFGLEAVAAYYARPDSLDQLRQVVQFSQEHELEYLILGGGSNILFKQDYYSGLVIHLNLLGVHVEEHSDHFRVVVGASENWHELTQLCVGKGIVGLENLSLIPGTVGACPVQNIGAYGVEVAEFISSVVCYDPQEDEVVELSSDQCVFGYRDSVFKHDQAHLVILEVRFVFSKEREFSLQYGDIAKRIEEKCKEQAGLSLTAKLVSDVICEIRSEKLPDPKVIGNAGSFFKNPIVDTSVYASLKHKYPNLVGFPYGDQYKLAAGWMIDYLGYKGKTIGGAGVHKLQALVLVNVTDCATSEELFSLVESIQEDVRCTFGVCLEVEPRIIG